MAKTYSFVNTIAGNGWWYVYDSATDTVTGRINTAGDLFSDSPAVGDCVIASSPSGAVFNNGLYDTFHPNLTTVMAYTSATFAFEYWNGSAWAALPGLVDNSSGFTVNDAISWTIPADIRAGGTIGTNNLASRYFFIRARITAISGCTEGGAGYIKRSQFYVDVSGGTSGDPVTFADIYDYVVNTLGRTDLAFEFEDRKEGTAYLFYVNVYTHDYVTDRDLDIEWNGGAFYFDDNCKLTDAHFTIWNGGGVTYFYTDDTWTNVTSVITDSQRQCKYSGTGTYNYCVFKLKHCLWRFDDTMTFNNCKFDPSSGSWFGPNSNSITVDFNDSIIDTSYLWPDKSNAKFKNVIMNSPSTQLAFRGQDMHIVNFTNYSPTSSVSTGTDDIYFDWEFDLTVIDTNGSAIQTASVTIQDSEGTQVYSGTTDANGEIATQELTQRYATGPGASGQAITYTNQTPHTITISKSGYITQTHKITVDKKQDLTFTLKEKEATELYDTTLHDATIY